MIKSTPFKRIAFLSSELASYLAACQRKLQEEYNIQILVVHWPIAKNAPFNKELFEHINYLYNKAEHSFKELDEHIENFGPDALIISGWMDTDYLRLAKIFKKKGIPVIAGSDTQWTGSLRQHSGSIVAPFYLHPSIDIMWVTGDRQKRLAQALGYKNDNCWTGYYACDWEKFSITSPRNFDHAQKAFFYVGRYIPRKGIDILIDAYRTYRNRVDHPWELWTAGTGPEDHLLTNEEGIKNLGFVQPTQLPNLFKKVTAFVLPSKIEPWGVVVQEAAAAGLPLICSDASGASDHLLKTGKNGYLFSNGNVEQLVKSFQQMSLQTVKQWGKMSQISFELSKQYTPEIWAKTLINGLEKRKRTKETA